MRKKRLLKNTLAAIGNQLVTLAFGLILPRLILSHYGSATNGLIASITQFLAFFSLTEMGVGAVVRASLYKPLAEGYADSVSRILISSRRFFNKIGGLLLLYTLLLMIYFPLAVDHRLGYLSTAMLVGAVAFSSICKYLFGIVYTQLLNADQRAYIQLGCNILTTILNTLFSVILIQMDASIVTVKAAAALVLLLNPLLLRLYVDRHYTLNFRLSLTEEPLKQKWNGLAQHIATYVLKHADMVILTIFSTLENVSIYYVYHLVTNGLQQMIEVTSVGMSSLLGNLYAKREMDRLQQLFAVYEMLNHAIVVLVYSCAFVLILPFIHMYTNNVTDTEYILPLFAFLIVLANGVYCLRLPYYLMVQAAGHFRETQMSAVLEAGINIVISVILVVRYGLVGVAIGTITAMSYRTVYLAWYLRTQILHRKLRFFLKHLAVDAIAVILVIQISQCYVREILNWSEWLVLAIQVGITAVGIVLIVNTVFYGDLMREIRMLIREKRR